ncbi:N-acetylmuramoyl-L-alanine amidase, partial [Halobacillus sp. BBL2006]|uniref:N-acetylmuramoyl-L-alanine amidase n=1 Tax=Halobacillus sp. BBL2006 TaxID=1543706 RepID=UPI0005440649
WVAGWLVNNTQDESSIPTGSIFVSVKYNGTNIRSGPGTTDKIVGRGHKGDQFQVIVKQGQWYKVQYENKSAYIAGWLVNEHNGKPDSSQQVSGNLKGKTIMIDAGHGGKDSGALGRGGSYEKKITLKTALSLKSQLERSGAKVLMVRKTDEYVPLSIRSFYSNASEADVFISLHYNSAPLNVAASGISSFYYHEKDKPLAASIQAGMVGSTNLIDRGTLYGDFHVLRENRKPSVLLELGFLSDAIEEQTVRSSKYQTEVSQGITQGLINYFN